MQPMLHALTARTLHHASTDMLDLMCCLAARSLPHIMHRPQLRAPSMTTCMVLELFLAAPQARQLLPMLPWVARMVSSPRLLLLWDLQYVLLAQVGRAGALPLPLLLFSYWSVSRFVLHCIPLHCSPCPSCDAAH